MKPLDQERVSKILGSTMRTIQRPGFGPLGAIRAQYEVVANHPPATYVLTIKGMIPATVNQLMASVKVRIRLKKSDRSLIYHYSREQNIPLAKGKRRVSLRISKKGKLPDPDAFWKSTLDALVQARLLIGDDSNGVELGTVEVVRGERETRVILEEISRE